MRRTGIAQAAALLAALLVGGGCLPGGRILGPPGGDAERLTAPEVKTFLARYCGEAANRLEIASGAMQHELPDRAARRRVTLWKMRVVSECQRASSAEDPVLAFLDTWVVAVQHEKLLEAPHEDGGPLFGDQQPVAIEVAEDLRERIERVAPLVLPAENLEEARAGVYRLVEQQIGSEGVSSLWSGDPDAIGLTVLDQPMFGWATGIALSPFRALEGVDEGAQAAHRLADVAERYAAIAEQLPQQMRWQMELVLYDVEDRDTVEVLRETAAQLGGSAERLSSVAEGLPEDLRENLTLLLGDVGAQGGALEPTLVRTRETVDSLTVALGALEEATGALDRTLTLIRDWPRSEPDPDAPRGRPFDITEYTAALETATVALTEVRAVLDEARALGSSPALTASAEEIDATLRGLVDHVALRLVQVLGLALVGIAFTVLIVRRASRGAGTP